VNGGMDLKGFASKLLKTLLILMIAIGVTGICGIVTEVVAEAAVTMPSLKENKKTIYVGSDTYQIGIKNLTKEAVVTYQSSNTKIVTVSKSGKVKPVAKGSAVITANVKQNRKTYSLKISILVKIPSVSLTATTDYLNVSETYQFKASSKGIADPVVWSVSNKTIATISAKGKLTAMKDGKVTVYAKAGNSTVKYNVVIGTNRLGTFSKNITLYDEVIIWISTSDYVDDEALTVTTDTNAIISCTWGEEWVGNQISLTLKAKNIGNDRVIITSDKTNDQLILDVTVEKEVTKKKTLTATEIYKKCDPATVEIVASDDSNEALGSGFFVSNGVVVTNYHVIRGAKKIAVRTYDEKEYEVYSILGYNEDLDLAILKVNSDNSSLLISQQRVEVGENIYALGSPFGLTGTLSGGMVSTASRKIDGVDFIQITASISPGNSGGPLLNEHGEVIGVNTMFYENGQNLNFAININELQKISTNRPISVEELYERSIIYEDPAVSQNYDTSQFIPFGRTVKGSITAEENGDCYWFNVTDAGTFYGIIESANKLDRDNTYFQLYEYKDDNVKLINESKFYEDKLNQFIVQTITPGEYVIFIFSPTTYDGPDIPYNFTLYYE
jgi:hypothetical protein